MGRKWISLVAMLLTVLIISACGTEKEESTADGNESIAEESNKENMKEESLGEDTGDGDKAEETEDEDEAETTISGSGEFSELITFMENETEGTSRILYESNEPNAHELDGVTVTLDAYTLVELTDFHADFSIPFQDETEGGVLLAQYTISNNLEKDVYYMPSFDLSFIGASRIYANQRYLLPEEKQLPNILSSSEDYELKAGGTVTGYIAYSLGKTHLEQALDVSTVMISVPRAEAVKGDFGNPIGKKGQFMLAINETGTEKVAANAVFYRDEATVKDMGEKKMLKEESSIGKSEQLGDVTVTLEGYQFTEFIPNEYEAPAFVNFPNGIVLLTVEFNLDNKGSEPIGLSYGMTRLLVNDGAQSVINQGMLLDYSLDVMDAGKSGEYLQIYALDQEQYEKIWKDKLFQIEFGPVKNAVAKDISKGKKVTFEL